MRIDHTCSCFTSSGKQADPRFRLCGSPFQCSQERRRSQDHAPVNSSYKPLGRRRIKRRRTAQCDSPPRKAQALALSSRSATANRLGQDASRQARRRANGPDCACAFSPGSTVVLGAEGAKKIADSLEIGSSNRSYRQLYFFLNSILSTNQCFIYHTN